jgi:hypothetical protein
MLIRINGIAGTLAICAGAKTGVRGAEIPLGGMKPVAAKAHWFGAIDDYAGERVQPAEIEGVQLGLGVVFVGWNGALDGRLGRRVDAVEDSANLRAIDDTAIGKSDAETGFGAGDVVLPLAA